MSVLFLDLLAFCFVAVAGVVGDAVVDIVVVVPRFVYIFKVLVVLHPRVWVAEKSNIST